MTALVLVLKKIESEGKIKYDKLKSRNNSVKNSHLLTFPDDKAEILAVFLSKFY